MGSVVHYQFSVSGITTVLTLSTIALESRTDLPKVHYATALDWFIICSFGYCIATLLEFAGVHYFTKVRRFSYKCLIHYLFKQPFSHVLQQDTFNSYQKLRRYRY